MGKEERIVVRLPADQLVLLSELVRKGKYSSESDAVKDAVTTLLKANFTEEEAEKVIAFRSAEQDLDLDDFTSNESPADEILYNVMVKGLESERKDL